MSIREKNELTINSIRLIMTEVLSVMKDVVEEQENDELIAETLYDTVAREVSASLDEFLEADFVLRELSTMTADFTLEINLETRYSRFTVVDDGEVVFESIGFLP